MKSDRQVLAEQKAKHNHPGYAKLSFLMGCGIQRRGIGSHAITESGRKVLALFDQYGNQSFGYAHPEIVETVRRKLDSGNVNSTKIMFEEDQIHLARELSVATDERLSMAYFSNSGGEAIDNALKLARAHTRRPKFVSALGCFHGKTFAALSASGRPEHAALFEPWLPVFQRVPFNDVSAMRAAVDEDTAAVLLEPVQAEAGVVVPTPEYLHEVRELCTERGALLIFDEMQTAFGRLGTLFGFQRFGVVPDIMCLGKAFGGGIVPLSAVVARSELWTLLSTLPSTFGSSLGGNPISCAVGRTVLGLASREDFLARVRDNEAIIAERLARCVRRYPALIRAHRGLGMMHGLEFREETLAGLVLSLLYEKGVASTYSLYNTFVLRVQPPMPIAEEELSIGLDKLEQVLEEVSAYRASSPSVDHSRPRIDVRWRLPLSAESMLKLLRRSPSSLDPFARSNNAARAKHEAEFDGILGAESVVWSDELTAHPRGLTARATAGWPWRSLVRDVTVAVASDTPEECDVSVRVEWDAGTAVYEPFIAASIGYRVRQRLKQLFEQVERQECCTSVDAGTGTTHTMKNTETALLPYHD